MKTKFFLAWLLALLCGNSAWALSVTANPTSCANATGIGSVAWSNPGRATRSDNSRATAKSLDGTTSNYLWCTGFKFAIPASATITGIVVSVERRASSTNDGGSRDASVRLIKAGALTGLDRATTTTYTKSDVVQAHGSSTDVWGTTWTPAEINAGNFGTAYAGTKPNRSGGGQNIDIDNIKITVYYSGAYPPGVYTVTGSPSTCINVTGIGSKAWTSPDYAKVSDNVSSGVTSSFRGTTTSNWVQCTGYGFDAPVEAIINGISVGVERRISSTKSASAVDNAMRLVKGGVIGTVDRASATAYTTVDAVGVHGSTSDLWGTTWTPADIDATNFGAAFSAKMTNTSGKNRSVLVDAMTITVTFTVPAPLPMPADFNTYDTGTTPVAALNGRITTKVAGRSFDLDIAAINTTRTGLVTTFDKAVKVEMLDASNGGTLDVSNCNAGWTLIKALPNQTFTGTTTGAGKDATVTGTGGRHRITGIVEANAWQNVAVRVSYPATGTPTLIGCSTDHFAIRPAAFANITAKDADWETPGTTRTLNNTNATGGVTHKAGQPFTLTATAVNAGGATTTNYVGEPTVALATCSSGSACTTVLGNLVVGATAIAGLVTSDAATYDEVGAFSLTMQDQSFANIDAGDGTAESCAGRWICSSTPGDVGRFVPDHFSMLVADLADRADMPVGSTTSADAFIGDSQLLVGSATYFPAGTLLRIPDADAGGGALYARVTGVAGNAITLDTPLGSDLAAGSDVLVEPGFTYLGELMNLQLRLVAQAADGSTTTNYDGVLAKLDPTSGSNPLGVALVDNGATRTIFPLCGGTPAHPCFRASAASCDTSPCFAGGVADITDPITAFRGATPIGPYSALDIGVAPTDADGVTTDPYDLDADTTAGNDHTWAARTELRYGRMRLGSAYGSELLPLPIVAIAQYWNGSSFVTNAADSQTAIAPTDFLFSNYTQNLTTASVLMPPASIAFGAGIGSFRLAAPGAGRNGSVDLINTAPSYLPGNTTRAAFGLYKSPLIYRRERY